MGFFTNLIDSFTLCHVFTSISFYNHRIAPII
nr:MAG TPA: hypothetical protein [Caudoviricetes sp.]DAY96770.1 MAG TPA: hypothetical protein [Caudoviricetes sp.]